MKKYYWMVGIYLVWVFVAAEIYAFVYDVEVSDHIEREYIEYNSNTEDPISFQEWMDRQDERHEEFLDWFADGCDAALNPWYNERGND